MNKRAAYLVTLALMTAVPLALVGYKLLVLGYTMNDLVPSVSHRIDLGLQVAGHGEDIRISTYLPISDARQSITEEQGTTGTFSLSLNEEEGNRMAVWSARAVRGQQSLLQSFVFQGRHFRYDIPEGLRIPSS